MGEIYKYIFICKSVFVQPIPWPWYHYQTSAFKFDCDSNQMLGWNMEIYKISYIAACSQNLEVGW